MSWNDLRKGRYSQENNIYFITFVVRNRQPLFLNFYVAQIFCQLISQNGDENQCEWLTWVLMPDHFHGLLRVSDKSSLSKIIRQLKSKSAVKINHFLNQRGSLWQHAYFDRALRKDDDIKSIARYIVANPLRANIVRNVRAYSFWDSVYLKT